VGLSVLITLLDDNDNNDDVNDYITRLTTNSYL